MPIDEKYRRVVERNTYRYQFTDLLIKLMGVCEMRGLRLIVENPWAEQTYLKQGFIKKPTLVDMDRTRRGDFFTKPTAYWFISCAPTYGRSYQPSKVVKRIEEMRSSKQAGICSEERSMISPTYARNFICDFILGKEQRHSERMLFEVEN